MIRSMTAFAACERAATGGSLGCELRAVNHRFQELGIRAPEEILLLAFARAPQPMLIPAGASLEEHLRLAIPRLNAKARAFYEKHGVKLIADAYEAGNEKGMVSLMITRHCLRGYRLLLPGHKYT